MESPQVWRWLPLVAFVSCLLPAAAGAAPEQPSLADARNWLAKIQAAAHAGNYQGVLNYTAGGTITSSRVAHFAAGNDTYEWLEALDGDLQRVLRHNDDVLTLRPQARQAVVEKRERLAPMGSTPQAVEPQALEQYDFRRDGNARVAGRDTAVIVLEPRDALRYAQRLWADVASGLMLRADVMGPGGNGARQVLESTSFSEIAVGLKPQPELVMQEMRNPRRFDGFKVVRLQHQRTQLEAEGWELKRPVAGFRLAGCVRRSMESAGDEGAVLQAVFTDGLTHVSLFIEPYKPLRHVAEFKAQQGAAGTLTQRLGASYWLTAVGDVPLATLKLFADAIERRK